MRAIYRITACIAVAQIAAAPMAGPVQVTTYTGARWFDGSGFVPATVTVTADRRLTFSSAGQRRPEPTVDLASRFVMPPFCEGHNHNIAVGKPEERNARYMAAGVFYVQILNDAPDIAGAEAGFWSRPDTVDVVFAHGAVTGPGGHPVELIEGIARGGGYPAGTRLAGRTYFEVRDAAEMDVMWPAIVASKPDVIKLFLQFSEEYERRLGDPSYVGNRGLSVPAFNRAVELAHRDRLRVAAHVVSAADFHAAIMAGADVIAHLPGYMGPVELDRADAERAARQGTRVMTTASLARSFAKGALEATQRAQQTNLRVLREAGVTLVPGSDSWSDTSHGEVRYLRALGVFSDVELLRMWTQNCAETLFPERRIGRVADGFEADFLVLDGNPLVDFEATRRIIMRVKAGRVVD